MTTYYVLTSRKYLQKFTFSIVNRNRRQLAVEYSTAGDLLWLSFENFHKCSDNSIIQGLEVSRLKRVDIAVVTRYKNVVEWILANRNFIHENCPSLFRRDVVRIHTRTALARSPAERWCIRLRPHRQLSQPSTALMISRPSQHRH